MLKQETERSGGEYALVAPRLSHYQAVSAMDEDFAAAGEEPYCGAASRVGYALWVWTVREQAREGAALLGGNPNEILFLVRGGEERILACGQLRPVDTEDVLTWAGHIGYSVPPSLRGRGYAQTILRLLLEEAFARGMEEVLLTCDETNAASRRVIEKAGGAFKGHYRARGYNKRRYWFSKGNTPNFDGR
ncbi:MAG: GNAT family N-acetyltransferase [Christensenellaceae bacterium]|nr:GNAT family N-acetyltransferase [Christensenellaceae bacterium]